MTFSVVLCFGIVEYNTHIKTDLIHVDIRKHIYDIEKHNPQQVQKQTMQGTFGYTNEKSII